MAAMPMTAQTRLSFAKVAASGGKENVALNLAKHSTGVTRQDSPQLSTMVVEATAIKTGRTRTGTVTHLQSTKLVDGQIVHLEPRKTSQDAISEVVAGKAMVEEDIIRDLSNLSIQSSSNFAISGGAGVNTASQHFLGGSSLEELQRIDSPPEASTKPPSLDGKSITSGTTFALDEKESLRPDDSASVKAAEDDDTFSGRGSVVAGSRIGSEAAARAYRSQVSDVHDKRAIPIVSELFDVENVIPRSSSELKVNGTTNGKQPRAPAASEADGFGLFYKQSPDDQLLEALESSSNRVFLLRLEQQVIQFVKDSKEPFMDSPPCNSFCRMLAHKLADYYHLTHTLDGTVTFVRIFRTPFCRLPNALATYSASATNEHDQPPNIPTMKIMRRGDGHIGSSKATSEVGSDGKEKGRSTKEKQSREQREAEYKKARERIFGATGEEAQDTDNSNDISRSSSVSVKDRVAHNKKTKLKQRRSDSDGFESRATFTPFYGQPSSAWMANTQYMPQPGQQYHGSMQSPHPTPPGPYDQSVQSHGPFQSHWNGTPQMIPLHGSPGYGQMQPSYFTPNVAYPPRSVPFETTSPPHIQNMMSPWAQNGFQGSHQQTVPYAFGQLPNAADPADLGRQHPIPGSFVSNRHAFNPQTQSFVPGSTNPSPSHAAPHITSPQMPYHKYSYHPGNNLQSFPVGGVEGGNMYYLKGHTSHATNGHNPGTSYQPYHTSPNIHASQMMLSNVQHNMPNNIQHALPQNIPTGYSQVSNHSSHNISHFGNAAKLPSKPSPTSQQ